MHQECSYNDDLFYKSVGGLKMTDDYRPGKGHPKTADKTSKKIAYSDELHGNLLVMCSRPSSHCHNMAVKVKDYAMHLQNVHKMQIDPVQERLMKSSAMVSDRVRKDKWVWAPFPYQIPLTIYEMHLEELLREKEGQAT